MYLVVLLICKLKTNLLLLKWSFNLHLGTCNSSAGDSVEMNKSAHFEKNAVFSQTSIQEKLYKVSAGNK